MKPLTQAPLADTFNQKVKLRTKIGLILNREHLESCHSFVDKINLFNHKIIDYSRSPSFVNNQIIKSKKFRFGSSSKPWTVHYMATEQFNPDYSRIKALLLQDLTKEELYLVGTDIDFYIKDKELRKNLDIFDYKPLTDTIIQEEINNNLSTQKKKKDTLTALNDNSSTRVTIKKIRVNNIIKECFSSYSHDAFGEYLKQLIQLNKEKDLKREKKEKEMTNVVNRLIKSSQVELDNCNKIIKTKKNLINSLKEKIERFDDNDCNKGFNYITKTQKTIQTEENNNAVFNKAKKKKAIKQKIYIKEFKFKNKQSLRNNHQQKETETDNFIKQYTRTIKDILTSQTVTNYVHQSFTLPLIKITH